MNFYDLIAARRSYRKFERGELEGELVQKILRAALMSPTSRNQRAWRFVVVESQADLEKLADVKENGSQFIKDAAMAVVVTGCPTENDCWVEDGCLAAFAMQLQAEDVGVASCWVQVRGRRLSDGTLSADVVRGILDIPESQDVLCIIAFGNKSTTKPPHDEEDLKWENVCLGKYVPRE